MLEKTLESPLDYKEIQPVHPKGNQSWIFIGRIDAAAETPILWPPNAKNCLTRRDPDAGKDWRWEEKGTTKDEMVGWHHWLDGHEFEELGVGFGQRSLATAFRVVADSWIWLSNRTKLTDIRGFKKTLISEGKIDSYRRFHIAQRRWSWIRKNQKKRNLYGHYKLAILIWCLMQETRYLFNNKLVNVSHLCLCRYVLS